MTSALREARVRRAFMRHGILLRKDRSSRIGGDHFGGYMLKDVGTGGILAGARYDWTIEDCEDWLRGE